MVYNIVVMADFQDKTGIKKIASFQLEEKDINSNGHEYVKERLPESYSFYGFAVYDEAKDELIHFLPYSDLYGKVNFRLFIPDLTLKELFHYFGDEKTVKVIIYPGGVGGDSGGIINALNVVLFVADLIGHSVGLYKIVNNFKDPFLDIDLFSEYIYSKETWTLKKLKKSFDVEEDEVIIELMKLFGYEYEENQDIFTNKSYKFELSEYMMGIPIREQYKIVECFLDQYSNEGELKEMKKTRLLSLLQTKISEEKLNLIFRDLDSQIKFLSINMDDFN